MNRLGRQVPQDNGAWIAAGLTESWKLERNRRRLAGVRGSGHSVLGVPPFAG
jgi:hypothetical protein